MLCTNCKKEESHHEESNTKALCDNCMDALNVCWDNECHEFVDAYVPCPDCGGSMSWCTCCEMYSQNCCIDYGTCQCS